MRPVAFAVLCALCVLGAISYALVARARTEQAARRGLDVVPPSGGTGAGVAAGPHLAFQSTALDDAYGVLALVPIGAATGGRTLTDLRCEVVSAAGGRGICLSADRGVLTRYGATVFDERLRPVHRLSLSGIPSRTRVAPDGRVGAMTVFVSGHSYAVAGFSTETTFVDLVTGQVLGNLEEFTVMRDGRRFHAVDFNFWGVTFAPDGDRFFATLGTAGQTYLVEGNVSRRQARVVRDNVECPSLSPDGTRIVFKKRVSGGLGPVRWRYHLLDLATLTETPLAEDRSVDDQAEWLDDAHVLYAVPQTTSPAVTDTWVVPVDGTGAPSVFVRGASTPAVVRPPGVGGGTG